MIQNVGPQLSQWDVGRSVSITDSEATHIHFANQGDSRAVIIEIEAGSAKIPDYLLQTGKTLIAYAVSNGVTLEAKSFSVRKRERPESYVYEDDQRNYIYKLIADAETAVVEAKAATQHASETAETAAEAADSAKQAALSAAAAAEAAIHSATNADKTAMGLMVLGEAKGTNISLDDSAKQFFVGLRIFGKTTQDGTPTPEVPVELVSAGDAGGEIGLYVAGKNLFANSETHAVDATGAEVNNSAARRTPYIPVKPGQKIAFSKSKVLPADSEPNGMLRMFNKNKQYVSSITALGYAATEKVVTIPDGIYFVRFVQYGFTYVDGLEVQMEIATAATEYDDTTAQYLALSTPDGLPGIRVTSGGNYTDADGQRWICDEIDLDRGVYVQRVHKAPVSAFNSGGYGEIGSYTRIALEIPSTKPSIATPNGMCNIMPMLGNYSADQLHFYAQNRQLWVFVPIDELEEKTTAGVLAWLQSKGAEFLYILATPIETAISEEELAAFAALHTNRPNTTIYNDAAAYMDLEYIMDTKIYIDRLVRGFSAWLTSVTLLASAWQGSNNLYSQVVTINGTTENSKVDLLPSVEQLAIFYKKDLAFVTENEGGVVTVYAIGDKPTNDYTIQAQVTEVNV